MCFKRKIDCNCIELFKENIILKFSDQKIKYFTRCKLIHNLRLCFFVKWAWFGNEVGDKCMTDHFFLSIIRPTLGRHSNQRKFLRQDLKLSWQLSSIKNTSKNRKKLLTSVFLQSKLLHSHNWKWSNWWG